MFGEIKMSMERWVEIHNQLLNGNYDFFPSHNEIRTGNPIYKNCFSATPNYGKPIWDGRVEPIVLLVNADFGMGDTIQFYRFLSWVKCRVAKVILRCDGDFSKLFSDVEVVDKAMEIPEFNKVIHMMALPLVLGIKKEDIVSERYISPNLEYPIDADLKNHLGMVKFTKIGICWQGNPFNPRDRIRSMPMNYLNDFLDHFLYNFDLRMFSLDKIGLVVPNSLFNMKPYMGDWNKTAQLIELMDIVVTVDTAVAHLAGALGKKTYLVVPKEDPDWRWGKVGEETLWYKSIKLFRNDNWEETIKKLQSEIEL